jgi:hypothetical protein
MDGPEMLTYDRLGWWMYVRKLEIPDWEIDVLLDLDDAYVREALTPLPDTE